MLCEFCVLQGLKDPEGLEVSVILRDNGYIDLRFCEVCKGDLKICLDC